VVVSDYPGLGTPGYETYNVGIPSAYAVLDALRAATRLPAAGLNPAAPMGIEGYSQGGGTAAWAAQLAATYAPELAVRGVAAGGTPANLQAVAANINGTLFFAFLGGTALGFGAAYPSLDLNSYLTPYGRAALAALGELCQVEALALYAGQRIENYTVGGTNPINTPPWKAVLDANNLGGIKPAPPILLYHGLLDEIIPWQVANNLHRTYCGRNATTQLRSYLGEHVTTHLLAQTDVVTWLADRLAGTPARRQC
jgi:pimeloyl-ACP methyl ester carboxylesterase